MTNNTKLLQGSIGNSSSAYSLGSISRTALPSPKCGPPISDPISSQVLSVETIRVSYRDLKFQTIRFKKRLRRFSENLSSLVNIFSPALKRRHRLVKAQPVQ
jgi:hypothetical protein